MAQRDLRSLKHWFALVRLTRQDARGLFLICRRLDAALLLPKRVRRREVRTLFHPLFAGGISASDITRSARNGR